MELKKNPDADVRKNSWFYLALGLALVSFIVWQGIEWKTYDEVVKKEEKKETQEEEEDMIVTMQETPPPPPPPPPPAPEVIEVVEDEEEVEETVIESTETTQEEEIEAPAEVEVEEEEEIIEEVSFMLIEDTPIFPGCEKEKTKKAKKDCMSAKVNKHINKRFNTDLAADLDLTGKQKIYAQFIVDENGNITAVQARAPHPKLQKEAIKAIKSLPRMKPGKQRGKRVKVKYSLPIVFSVRD